MGLKVAVVGGTGVLGRLVVKELLERGDEVRVLSRSADGRTMGAPHRRADLETGEGLDEGLRGVEVVVDASNSRERAQQVLVEGGERLLAAAADAGVRHHVAVSIVGCDRVPIAYYKAKVAQERAVEGSAVPWSLLRASQFHQLFDWAFGSAARFGFVPTGAARLQPIDPAAVAPRIAAAVHGEPGGRLPDVAGPETMTLSELARIWRRARGRRSLPLRIPMVGARGRALRRGDLCDPAAAIECRTFERWLADE
ncbi:MAG TPA: NAD(P)H-binding protein [Solirubrobacterales bacterium]|jgi:uncharacterized protein YbjT (DUF2867 family)|nr:NAD(P)H-binding protein [Solirubrobacterales bacterium]